MNFSLQDWAAIGEIIGAVAILVTLVYLSIQVRQANRSLKVSTSVMGSEYTGTIFQQWVTDPEFVDIYLKGMTELDALNKNEKFRFINFVNQMMRYFEHQFVLYQSDALPADFWIGQETSLRMIISAPGVRESWLRQEAVFSPSFRSYVSSQLAKPPLPLDDLLN